MSKAPFKNHPQRPSRLCGELLQLKILKGDLNEGRYRLHPWLFDTNRFTN